VQPYSNPTKRNMEDYLNTFENRRRPQLFFKGRNNLNFFRQWKTPQNKIMQQKQLKVKKNKVYDNCRQHTFFLKRKTTSIFLKREDYLKNIMQLKTIQSKYNDCGTAPGNLVSIMTNLQIYYFS
jgi:hypothetical protein